MTSIDIINYPNTPINNNFLTDERMIWYKNIIQDRLLKIIKDIRNKKIRNFVDAYRIVTDSAYKIEDCMLIRHFLLETIEEINNDFIKNNKPIRIRYSDKTYNQFIDEN